MKKVIILTLALSVLLSCGGSKTETSNIGLQKTDAVKVVEQPNGNRFVTLNVTQLKETTRVPLSAFIKDINVVKLESSEEALIGGDQLALVYDNYILVRGEGQMPVKLFDKSGKFIAAIGTYGRGANEYMNIYDLDLDEENGVIYILPWMTDKLLRFDLKGEPLPAIPLVQQSPKGVFKVDTKAQKLSMFVLPFSNEKLVSWTQDFEGNVITQRPNGTLAVHPDFSNEVNSSGNNKGIFDAKLFVFGNERTDTLYTIESNGALTPKFALDFGSNEIIMHDIVDIKNFYFGQIFEPKALSEYVTTTQNHLSFIVDKKTQEAGFVEVYDDFFSGKDVQFFGYKMKGGKYISNYDPEILRGDLEEGINSVELSEDAKKRAQELLDQIDDNDNNYIIWGELK